MPIAGSGMYAHWDYAYFVGAAYGISAAVLFGLVAWIVFDQRGRRREIAELEASGVRRRSAQGEKR
jgi:heme exporter protein D